MKEATWRVSTTTFMVLASAFALVSIAVIFAQAVYIPYWDQWDWYRRYFSPRESAWSLAFSFVNGHLLAVPSLLYRFDLAVLHGSNYANLVVLIASVIAVAVMLRGAMRNLASTRPATANLYFAAVLVLMFWFYNWENLFWPFQVHFYLSVVFAIAGLRLLAHAALYSPAQDARPLVLALLMGLLAAASSGGGVAFWPGAIIVIAVGSWPWRWKVAAIAATALGMGYQAFLMMREGVPQPGSIDWITFVNFVVEFLGSPALFGGNLRVLVGDARSLTWTMALGFAAVVLAAFIAAAVVRTRFRRALDRGELFFVGLAVLALSAAAFAALGRAGRGLPSPAVSSRYGLWCLLFWVAVAPLVLMIRTPSTVNMRRIEAFAPFLLLIAVIPSHADYLRWWMAWRNNVEWASASLISGVPDPEYLGYVFPPNRNDTVEQVTATLLKQRTSPLYTARIAELGHPVAEFGTLSAACAAGEVRQKPLRGGVRLQGTVHVETSAFGMQRVYVTDDKGIVVGVGTVERRWPASSVADLPWTAYAPTLTDTAPAQLHVHVARGNGLCTIEVPPAL